MLGKNLVSDNELLLAVCPGDDGALTTRFACLKGRKVTATGEGEPPSSTQPLRAAVYSLDSYFEQADLTVASVKLLPLVARRHVDAELAFDDTSYRLRALCRRQRERTMAADIVAMPEADLEDAAALLPMTEQPCLQLVPLELAIAGLVNRITAKPAIVFWEKGGVLLSLLVAGGMVQTRMRERVAGNDRDVIISRAAAGLKASAARLDENADVSQALYCGDLAGYAGSEGVPRAQLLEKALHKLYKTAGKVDKDAVLRDPELYGLPFVDDRWSFLESDYRAQVTAWRIARPAAALVGTAGVLFALYGGAQHLQARSIAADFDEQRARLNAGLAAYEAIRPSDDDMTYVRDHLALQEQSVSEVRLDHMLDWLTHMLPEGVVISGLEVKPEPAPRRRYETTPVQYPAGEKPFEVSLNIVLADAVLDDAEASAAEVVRRLSQRLKMIDSRLEVPAPEPNVRRNVMLFVKARAKAVNFS